MSFKGFADRDGSFWKALARHQDRDWFKEHKSRYEEDWVHPLEALLLDVRAGLAPSYARGALEEPKVFRIYRDVRFGKDKSPFKTNISGTISLRGNGGTMDKPVALYLQLGAETFAAAGHYQLQPEPLAKFRRAVADPTRGPELAKLVRSLEKKGFVIDAAARLVRVPRGFDADHPLADLLKLKGLVVRFPPLPSIEKPAFATWLHEKCAIAAPLVRWTAAATQ